MNVMYSQGEQGRVLYLRCDQCFKLELFKTRSKTTALLPLSVKAGWFHKFEKGLHWHKVLCPKCRPSKKGA